MVGDIHTSLYSKKFLVLVLLALLVSQTFAGNQKELFSSISIFPLSVNNSGCSASAQFGSISCGSYSSTSGSLSGTGQTKWQKVYASSSGIMNISLNGPSSTDFDLFVYSSCGGSSICSSSSTSSSEKCSINAVAGTYYYMAAYSYRGAGSYVLNASLSCGNSASCNSSAYPSCSSAYALANNSQKSGMCGVNQYYKISLPSNCNLTWTLVPSAGSDFDLYVKNSANACPSASSWTCRPYYGSGSTETCSMLLPSGTYYALVNKYSGSGSYSIKAVIANCNSACTNHSAYSCYSNDVYWFDSCGQRQDIKQDCGDSYNGTWGSNYCKAGNVYHNRTVYNKGCSVNSCYSTSALSEAVVQSCNNLGCSNGACNLPAGVNVVNYTSNVAVGYFGAIIWNTTGNVSETGVYVASKADKTDAKKVSVKLNNLSVYMEFISSQNKSCLVYARPYAKTQTGAIKYGVWETISIGQYCSSSSSYHAASGAACNSSDGSVKFEIGNINITALSGITYDFDKHFFIGNCDKDIFTFDCAFAALTTGGLFVATAAIFIAPEAAVPADAVLADSKLLVELSDGSQFLKDLRNTENFIKVVNEMRLYYRGVPYTVEAADFINEVRMGIYNLDFGAGTLRTAYPALAEYSAINGDLKIISLSGRLFSNAQMDRYLLSGVDLVKLNTYATDTKWSADQVDEAVTLARGLEKAEGANAVKQAMGNGYEISKTLPSGTKPDLYLKNINGKEITMEAKGFEVPLSNTNTLLDRLDEAGKQLAGAQGEKLIVLSPRAGTTLSETTLRATTADWLTNYEYGKQVQGVVVHLGEDSIIYITR